MAARLVSDELWETIEGILPLKPPKPKGGRPCLSERMALEGIVFVLEERHPLADAPQGGVRAQRRHLLEVPEGLAAGVWRKLWRALLDRLGRLGLVAWSRASVDSASVPAKRGGKTGPNPADRGRPGSKRHLLVDGDGTPLAVELTRAQVHDSKAFKGLVDGVGPVKEPKGRPRKRPNRLHADKGYDFPRCRKALRRRGIKARVARRGVDPSERLGRLRWIAERRLAWLDSYRRLCVRYERRSDIQEAFLELGCALVCFNRLRRRL